MRKPSTRDWSDLDATSAIIGELAAPPASIIYLAQAEAIVHDVATSPYACPGHMYDSLEEDRYHAVVLPLGVTHWRVAFVRCAEYAAAGTVQSGTLEVTPDADGFVRFDAYMQRPTGRDAYLYALVAYWRPGD